MSRSYKHYPFCKDTNSSKGGKTICNRRIRRNKQEMPKKGNIHKKMNEKGDFIYDFCSYSPGEDYIQWHGIENPQQSDYNYGYKGYKRK